MRGELGLLGVHQELRGSSRHSASCADFSRPTQNLDRLQPGFGVADLERANDAGVVPVAHEARAVHADAAERLEGGLQKTVVKHGLRQLDVPEVTRTLLQLHAARLAGLAHVDRAGARVVEPATHRDAVEVDIARVDLADTHGHHLRGRQQAKLHPLDLLQLRRTKRIVQIYRCRHLVKCERGKRQKYFCENCQSNQIFPFRTRTRSTTFE